MVPTEAPLVRLTPRPRTRNGPPVGGARRDLQGDRRAAQRGDLDLRTEGGLVEAEGVQSRRRLSPAPTEERMLGDLDGDEPVAGRTASLAGRTLGVGAGSSARP